MSIVSGNRVKLSIFKAKAEKEVYKIALAVVLTEFILVIAFSIGINTIDLNAFKPKTINIVQAQEQIEEPRKETSKETIIRVAKEEEFEDIDILIAIAKCESNFDTYAKNKVSSARGLFQILDMHELTEDERYNAEVSTKWTINKIRANGPRAWNSSKSCWNN